MCFSKPKKMKVNDVPEQPQPAAEEQDVGMGRKADDQSVYGGNEANLRRRTDPSATPAVAAGGSGLRMM